MSQVRLRRGVRTANAVLGLEALLCAFDFAYNVLHVSFSGAAIIAVYFAVPALASAILLFALVSRSKWKQRIALSSCVLLLGFWALDAALERKRWPRVVPHPAAPSQNLSEIERKATEWKGLNKSGVVRKLRESGVDAVGATWPQHRIESGEMAVAGDTGVFPLAGVSRKLTVLTNEHGSWSIYPSDEHGFNNPSGQWGSGKLAVAAVGDSFTQGAAAPAGQGFLDHIRRRMGPALNLGMAGNGPLSELATLKEYLPSERPETVLWVYFWNDLPELAGVEHDVKLLRRYLEPGFRQGLMEKQEVVDRYLAQWIDQKVKTDDGVERASSPKNSVAESAFRVLVGTNTRELLLKAIDRLSAKAAKLAASLRSPPPASTTAPTATSSATPTAAPAPAAPPKPPPGAVERLGSPELREAEALDLLKSILEEAQRTVAGWGGTLRFVYLPGWRSIRRAPQLTRDSRDQAVLDRVAQMGLPVIDCTPVFLDQKEPARLFTSSLAHYNEEGHRLVGEFLLGKLVGK